MANLRPTMLVEMYAVRPYTLKYADTGLCRMPFDLDPKPQTWFLHLAHARNSEPQTLSPQL
jgi:hypothetical protein